MIFKSKWKKYLWIYRETVSEKEGRYEESWCMLEKDRKPLFMFYVCWDNIPCSDNDSRVTIVVACSLFSCIHLRSKHVDYNLVVAQSPAGKPSQIVESMRLRCWWSIKAPVSLNTASSLGFSLSLRWSRESAAKTHWNFYISVIASQGADTSFTEIFKKCMHIGCEATRMYYQNNKLNVWNDHIFSKKH